MKRIKLSEQTVAELEALLDSAKNQDNNEDVKVQYIHERIEVLKDVMPYNEVMVYIDEFEPILARYKNGLKLNELAEDLQNLYKEFVDMNIQVRTVTTVNQCPF